MGIDCSVTDESERTAGINLRDERKGKTETFMLGIMTLVSVVGVVVVLCCNK